MEEDEEDDDADEEEEEDEAERGGEKQTRLIAATMHCAYFHRTCIPNARFKARAPVQWSSTDSVRPLTSHSPSATRWSTYKAFARATFGQHQTSICASNPEQNPKQKMHLTTARLFISKQSIYFGIQP